ncbi:general secretion pathway protein GspB [Glaciecola sp. KUL10]|uniref:general secretion pathway protein GspB n=1 Tax=Glaciecola sp. (strain KUL10) TaxID=2161813 RepID=UPI000D788D1A|nr:general secretion pathway protein GspB [Glaciecola sp. KUL10]GBL04815.1 general secretion pathway protein B [Glaciecola sp. KUL10]
MLKQVIIEELTPGMMVSRVVEQNGAVKIRKVGMIRSPEMIKGLKEMGVLKLEVDLEQSVGLESDVESEQALVTSQPTHKDKELTPTQLLMNSDKAVASADRGLSQQFHRSMFMPSPDTLPSKWHLYGRTASMFVGLIVLGGLLGFSLAKTPSWLAGLSTPTESSMPIAALSDDKNELENASVHDEKPADTDELENGVVAEIDSEIDSEATGESDSGVVSSVDESNNATNDEQAPIVLGYQPENAQALVRPNQVVEPEDSNTQVAAAPAISPELLAKFNAAIAELDSEKQQTEAQSPAQNNEYDDVPRVDQLPVAVLTDLPAMTFSAHMYASLPENRWVRVNGLRMVEGDYIDDQLQIVNIEPQRVILSFRENVFSMNALTDW